MVCHNCAVQCIRRGRNRNGTQRYQCRRCLKSFSEDRRSVGNMYTPLDRARQATQLLVEGNSIRSTARITGLETKTVMTLLARVGEGCRDLLRIRIHGLKVSHLELDELWTFVYKKQKRVMFGDPPDVGDVYCYIALDRSSRLVVAWHLGKRDDQNTSLFIRKVKWATTGSYQISTDAFPSYLPAIGLHLEKQASYARIVKVAAPGRIEGVLGSPELDLTETTYVERLNGTLRQHCKRFTRKTYAFSKRWRMLEAALGLFFAHYNFFWAMKRRKEKPATPAMRAKLTDHVWSLDELLEQVVVG
ncbi:MAG: hypothetical protein OXL36_06665 [Bryobacterales bacterium]|nr:hypothetical protein [Bryobacterales bacterium]